VSYYTFRTSIHQEGFADFARRSVWRLIRHHHREGLAFAKTVLLLANVKDPGYLGLILSSIVFRELK
jgi:hypothetical protein